MDVETVLHHDFEGLGRFSMEGATIDSGGKKSEIVEDDAGDAGFSSKKMGARIKGNVLKFPGVSIKALREFRGTITSVTEEGTTYITRNARCVSDSELGGGKVSMEWANIAGAEEVSAG